MSWYPVEVNYVQKSPEWLRWRKEGIGSSDAGVLMGNNRYKTVYQLWAEKTGIIEATFEMNADIQRGVDNEDNAVYLYNYRTQWDMRPRTYEHPYYKFMKASTDGNNPQIGRFIEVKCPRPWKHEKAKVHRFLSPEYYAQIQHMYNVLGEYGKFGMHFLSYLVPETPGVWGDLTYFEVPRNNEYINILVQREVYFWNCVQTRTKPNEFYFQPIFNLNTHF